MPRAEMPAGGSARICSEVGCVRAKSDIPEAPGARDARLSSGTSRGASSIGRSHGHFADVIAVEGNPLEDIGALGRVSFVMKAGQVYKAPR